MSGPRPAAPSRLERLPRRSLGPTLVPSLFLGDHGFLGKLDSQLSDAEIIDRMLLATNLADLGLAAGDARLVELAVRVQTLVGRRLAVMHHTDIPLVLDGRPLPYSRCAATLRRYLLDDHGVVARDDAVLRFLDHFEDRDPLTASECRRLRLDDNALYRDAQIVGPYGPAVVTVGGDCLDLAYLIGRTDLARVGLEGMRSAYSTGNVAIVGTLYVGSLVDAACKDLVDGIMVPINELGVAMLPDGDSLLRWALSAELPLIAMHSLAGGRRSPSEALRYCESVGVTTTVIGASKPASIQHLVKAAHAVLVDR